MRAFNYSYSYVDLCPGAPHTRKKAKWSGLGTEGRKEQPAGRLLLMHILLVQTGLTNQGGESVSVLFSGLAYQALPNRGADWYIILSSLMLETNICLTDDTHLQNDSHFGYLRVNSKH